jgi:hypothetical protein
MAHWCGVILHYFVGSKHLTCNLLEDIVGTKQRQDHTTKDVEMPSVMSALGVYTRNGGTVAAHYLIFHILLTDRGGRAPQHRLVDTTWLHHKLSSSLQQ